MHCTLRYVSVVVLGVLLGFHASLSGDTVHLKSGFKIDGKVSESPTDRDKLIIEINSTGRLTIPKSQVEAVVQNARTGIAPEKPAEEGQAAPLIVPNMVAVTLKKGQGYYGVGSLYGVKSPKSNDRVLILSIPALGEVQLPQEAVERIEPVAPVGMGAPAPAAAGPRTVRTTHRVKLLNGAVIPGTLVPSRPEEPLTLDVGSLGRLYLPRDRVVDISAFPGEMKIPEPEEEAAPPAAPAQKEETEPTAKETAAAPMMVSPELKQEIQDNLLDLTRWRSRNRVNAERRLVSLGPVVIPFLVQVSRDPFELTRRAVARIIRDIGHPSAIPIAIDLLMDEDNFVRETAAEGLRSITGIDLGYQPYASHESRYKAQQRWRQWWEEYSAPDDRGRVGR
jgi:hypothetical protein